MNEEIEMLCNSMDHFGTVFQTSDSGCSSFAVHSISDEHVVSKTSVVNSSLPIQTLQDEVNETIVYRLGNVFVFYWGWTGNLSFIYWDNSSDKGISNATVQCVLADLTPDVFDLKNGTYLVEVNTTELYSPFVSYLQLTFQKNGFETQISTVNIIVDPVPTDLVVDVPELNRIEDNPLNLKVPVGDAIDLRFFYNATFLFDGYGGGISGATSSVQVYGPTLVRNTISLTDLGNGSYPFLFNTSESWLFETTGGVPSPQELPYLLDVSFELENREMRAYVISISVIEIPTVLEIPFNNGYFYLETLHSLSVTYSDAWPTHNGAPISDATVIIENSLPEHLEVEVEPDPIQPGVYNILFFNNASTFRESDSVTLNITLLKENYETQVQSIQLFFDPGFGPPPPPRFNSLPFLIAVVAFVVIYRKWQQRLERNGQSDSQAPPDPQYAPNY
jgi:hypothetical protein